MAKKRSLNSITVPAPCPKKWDEMHGTDQTRFCGSCEKDIYNLSAMTRTEARKLLFESREKVCIRMERDEKGKIKTLKNQLHQITRHAPIAAGVLSATLMLSSAMMAQNKVDTKQSNVIITQVDKSPSANSSISGIITDQSGAVIPGVKIALRDLQNNLIERNITDSEGLYQFHNVLPLNYEISIESVGFKKLIYTNLLINGDKNLEIKFVMEAGNITMGVFISSEEQEEEKPLTPLLEAVQLNNLEEATRLIKAKHNVNQIDNYENDSSLLHIAVDAENIEMVNLLLKSKARVNVKDGNGNTPLILAVLDKNFEIIRLLLEAGANPNLKNKNADRAIDLTYSAEMEKLLMKYKSQAPVSSVLDIVTKKSGTEEIGTTASSIGNEIKTDQLKSLNKVQPNPIKDLPLPARNLPVFGLAAGVESKSKKQIKQTTFTFLDEAGALVSGVKVTLINKKTKKKITVSSDETGVAHFQFLNTGDYKVEAKAEGFATKKWTFSLTDSSNPNEEVILKFKADVTIGMLVRN